MGTASNSTDALLQTLYSELRYLASQQLRAERADHTLQATALVNEAYLRLKPDRMDRGWVNQSQFMRAAAEAMRRVLVDHARGKIAVKRGGNWSRLSLEELPIELPLPADELLAIHDCLDQFAEEDPVKAELLKLRVFAGMTLAEAACVLNLSRATADRYWAYAKARMMLLMSDESTTCS